MLTIPVESVQGGTQVNLSLATLDKTGGVVQLQLPGAFTGDGAVACTAVVGSDGSDTTVVSATFPTGLQKGATVMGVCTPGPAQSMR